VGDALQDWTVASQLAGSGLPLTPISFLAVSGTGVVGIRPARRAADAAAAAGSCANAARHDARARDVGNRRNSIPGPQFSLDMSVARVFLSGRWNLMAPDRDQRAQSRDVRDDRHGGDEPAVRFPDARQSDADAADGCEASLLTCAV
jgi:hypothetical protein